MKSIQVVAAASTLAVVTLAAVARDDVRVYSIADVLSRPEYARRLEGVKFYFGSEAPRQLPDLWASISQTRKLTRSISRTGRPANGSSFRRSYPFTNARSVKAGMRL